MQNSQLPAKWVKAFAVDDAAKVILPVTTAVVGRASQSLGFPPITMQPPESGGVPPQGEDFNGAMFMVASFVRWFMVGGAIPFDGTWAANADIGGYPNGARVVASDLSGEWFSTADNNTVNPDTVGTNWAPGQFYGVTAIAGLTNANVTLTPLQAAKPRITLAGTLTANIQIIVPNWARAYSVVNNTTGAFTVTVKTAAGGGVVVPQGGGTNALYGDGTNIVPGDGAIAGPGQTLQSVTGSRTVGTTYTNSTGRPIAVMVSLTASVATVATAQLNAVQVQAATVPVSGYASFMWIVPPGATYGVATISGAPTINAWNELR